LAELSALKQRGGLRPFLVEGEGMTKDPQKRKAHNRTYYLKNKKKYTDYRNARRKEITQWYINYKSKQICSICGEDHPACIEFHHRDPSLKDLDVSVAVARSWSIKRILKEIEKCDVVCSNCHSKIHWNERLSNSIGRVPDS
tara:strand:- start:10161 stop:10586 length:426 start_codon:yes stop_codon:yes gene_type:complete